MPELNVELIKNIRSVERKNKTYSPQTEINVVIEVLEQSANANAASRIAYTANL